MSEEVELHIARLGAQGDGVAETSHGPVFVPYTLAGERVRAEVTGDTGRLTLIVAPSLERVSPCCRHYGQCGGCKLQHMRALGYLAWKRELVREALRARGLDVEVGETRACAGPRRRAVFSARHQTSGVALGFHRAASHDLIDVQECPVLNPAIVAAMPGLRVLLAPLLSRKGEARVIATWTNAGLDVALEDIGAKLTPQVRALIAAAASEAGLARVSIAGDPVYEGLTPHLALGRAQVALPPGAFLQAVAEMETAMADLAVAAAGKAKAVADLFCGLGAFTFRLAERAKVFAADSDKAAIAALQAAARKATGLKPITALARDLFREPLSATELRDFDCVVFDPPRAGADAQARMIARSKVPVVVAVSCNPGTLARDARTLVDGGYRLESVTPLDQFRYSAHVEALAVFRR